MGMDEEDIIDDLARANFACEPGSPEHLGKALGFFLPLYKADEDWEDGIAAIYVELLADLPADLLDLALRRVGMASKWRPKPSEIRDAISEEFWARRQARSMLRMALRQMQATRGEMVA